MDNLLQNAVNGSKDDFIKLMSSIERELYYIARSRLNNREDINDVIQETIISCYENIKKVKDYSKFKSWVISILINNCNNLYRKNKKTIIFSYNQNDIDINENLINFTNYDEINSNVDFEVLLRLLNTDEKMIFTLFYSNQYTIKEISSILKINENSIKSKLKRAKEKVKLFIERSNNNGL